MRIDLNADLGESYGPWVMGQDADMFRLVTSANVACGGHAGDPDVMFDTLRAAAEHGVSIGAHPGYPDREGFGRRVIPMSADAITRMVAAQIGSLMGVAALAGADVGYVKPHGALSNLSCEEPEIAAAVVRAIKGMEADLGVLAISGTALEDAAREAGLEVFSEVFADRAYRADGRLVPRSEEGAVIHDAREATRRLVDFLKTGKMPVKDGGDISLNVDSICVHGDNPSAVETARTIRAALATEGFTIAPFIARDQQS
ncbi:5-oxoprolinase subunit PxpA [Maritimibacter sp. UBA3975]|uniref:LamB/YcsF family protein n=1 Tax=Maritimibacter sp. UBA3975 TaxID=1946833 RepID=UPI000C090F09|nr:5-oxoprolinase subunit PxpA [Maritimibacter sp. UBA3975]MAM62892.1 hypothetical protein [Maritimibacter sp.]|tara:strand:+ start:34238 stop:35011 length:774 start_codon:yes stop_codon:yes gene_type:complete